MVCCHRRQNQAHGISPPHTLGVAVKITIILKLKRVRNGWFETTIVSLAIMQMDHVEM
jgi:hypothetical protein